VTTRTPTQIGSHAQKYFVRQFIADRKKSFVSVLDISLTDDVISLSLSLSLSLYIYIYIYISNAMKKFSESSLTQQNLTAFSQQTCFEFWWISHCNFFLLYLVLF
jgi:hypothetical protein